MRNNLSACGGHLALLGFVSLMLVNTISAQGIISFPPRTDFQVGAFPNSVIAGDFNGDGFLDLITANLLDNTISILLRTG